MLLVGRSWEVGNEYRYGFNTQEQDDEVYGNGNLNTAEFWEFDTRIGRRWNNDPVNIPDNSPYLCFGNNPIFFNDIKGDSWDITKSEKDGKTIYTITLTVAVYDTTSDKSIDTKQLSEKIKMEVESVFSEENLEGAENVIINTTVNIRTITNASELNSDDHLIIIKDDADYDNMEKDLEGTKGVADFKGQRIFLPKTTAAAIIDGTNTRTISHEFGHTAGLYHPQDTGKDGVNGYIKEDHDNLMYQYWFPKSKGIDPNDAIKLNLTQYEIMYKNFKNGELNKQTQYKTVWKKMPSPPGSQSPYVLVPYKKINSKR